MLKTTSPASAGVTSLMVSMYLRPLLVTLKRPPFEMALPFRVHEHSSVFSRDKMHSKLHVSPSFTSADLSHLVIPMPISKFGTEIIRWQRCRRTRLTQQNCLSETTVPTSDSDLCLGNFSSEITTVIPSIVFGGVLDDQAQGLGCVEELILGSSLQDFTFLSPYRWNPGLGRLTCQSYHAFLLSDDIIERLEEHSKLLCRAKERK